MKDHVKLKVLVEHPLFLIPEIKEGLNLATLSHLSKDKGDSWHKIVFYLANELGDLQNRLVDRWEEILKLSRKGN